MGALNYKHLRYFWVVAKAGGVARASEQLHLTPQTVSAQLAALEEQVGHKLFARVGRRLDLTDVGRLVLSYADEIFTVGEELEEILRRPGGRALQLKVGVSDSVPKAVAYRLLEPSMRLPETLRIICREGKFATLLGDLAVHRLDIVLADSPMPATVNVRGFNHLLGECGVTFFATSALARRYKPGFPQSLDGAPMLMPGEDAAMRPRLTRWFEKLRIHPRVVGEFDDGALLKAFGQAGSGIFAAPTTIEREVCQQYGVAVLGATDAVTERFYAISVERRLTHPAVVAISSAARGELFGSK